MADVNLDSAISGAVSTVQPQKTERFKYLVPNYQLTAKTTNVFTRVVTALFEAVRNFGYAVANVGLYFANRVAALKAPKEQPVEVKQLEIQEESKPVVAVVQNNEQPPVANQAAVKELAVKEEIVQEEKPQEQPSSMKEFAKDLATIAAGATLGYVTAVYGPRAYNAAVPYVLQAKDSTVDFAKRAGSYVAETAKNAGSYTKDKATKTGSYISETAKNAGSYVKDTASQAASYLANLGSSVTKYVGSFFSPAQPTCPTDPQLPFYLRSKQGPVIPPLSKDGVCVAYRGVSRPDATTTCANTAFVRPPAPKPGIESGLYKISSADEKVTRCMFDPNCAVYEDGHVKYFPFPVKNVIDRVAEKAPVVRGIVEKTIDILPASMIRG